MNIPELAIKGLWNIVITVVGALVAGFFAGKSWEYKMLEIMYEDNKINLISQIETLKKEKNIANVNNEKLNQRYLNLKNEYDIFKNKYDNIVYQNQQLQKVINEKNNLSKKSTNDISQLLPNTPSMQKSEDDDILLMKVAPPYDFDDGKIYTNGKTFSMGGHKYTDGFVLSAVYSGYVLINLEHKYSELSFYVGHIDQSPISKGTTLNIFTDGNLLKDYFIPSDRPLQTITIPLKYSGSLKIQITGGHGAYGFANLILKK